MAQASAQQSNTSTVAPANLSEPNDALVNQVISEAVAMNVDSPNTTVSQGKRKAEQDRPKSIKKAKIGTSLLDIYEPFVYRTDRAAFCSAQTVCHFSLFGNQFYISCFM
jgi:hypothetical protein